VQTQKNASYAERKKGTAYIFSVAVQH